MEKEPIYNDIYNNDVPTTAEESPAFSASMSPSSTMAYADFLRIVKALEKKNKKLKKKDKKRKKKEKKRKKKEAKKFQKMLKHIAELEYRVSKSKPSDRYDWLKQIAVECTPMLIECAFSEKTTKKHKKKHKKKGFKNFKMLPDGVIDVPEGQFTVSDTEAYPMACLVDRSKKRS